MASTSAEPLNPTEKRSAKNVLLIFALVADALSVAAFVGVPFGERVRLSVAIVLAVVGLVVGATTLWNAITLLSSPRGSYYPAAWHLGRIAGGVAATLIALIFGAFLIQAGLDAYSRARLPSTGGVEPSPSDPARPATSTPTPGARIGP